jgi:hypothetical protein
VFGVERNDDITAGNPCPDDLAPMDEPDTVKIDLGQIAGGHAVQPLVAVTVVVVHNSIFKHGYRPPTRSTVNNVWTRVPIKT